MYKQFYGLNYNPFDKSLPVKDAFASNDHREMQTRLKYLKTTRGMGLFTASPGMGKTYALRCFAETLNLNPNLCEMSCLSTITVNEFYRQLCMQLGLERSGRKTEMFKDIQKRVHYLIKEKRKVMLIAIDECQYLDTKILRDLKMLMNQKYDSLDCFGLILLGLPYMNSVLEKPVHEALKQRIVVHYSFIGMTKDETADYIYTRIEAAGGARSIIDDSAGSCDLRLFPWGYPAPSTPSWPMPSCLEHGLRNKPSMETILAASNDLALV